MTTIRIRLLWHKQAQFAGYLLAEQLGLARARGVEIVCQGLDFAAKHVASVLGGHAEMCVASPAHVLESPDPDALRWILVIQQESPLVYPARRSDGITALSDLSGRRVGVWPGQEDLELRWMLRGAGIPDADVERIEMGDTVGPFLAGATASGQMTRYHELHAVEAAVDPADLVIFSAAPMGRGLLKDGLVCSRILAERDPETVQAVVDAVLEGWTIAFDEPDRAVAACLAARPDVDAAAHRRQLDDIRTLSLTGATLTQGLGYPDPAHATRAATALREVEGHDRDPRAILDARFWRAAPAAFRRSDWR